MCSKKILVTLVAALAVLSGCAHGLMRGSVAMKISDTEAHVCMDKSEAKVGDRVTLFRNNCPVKGGRDLGGGGGACTKVELGKGTVTETLNDHYSVVKFDPGVKFSEGTFVEKR